VSTAEPAGSVRSFLARWGAWMAIAAVVAISLAVGTVSSASPKTNADRLLAISQSLRCPVCSGESVAESNVSVSVDIRADIAKRIDQGQTDDQIRQYYADHYGEYILLTPKSTGVTSLVWIIPVVGLVLAFAGLAVAFQRWKVRGEVHATAADRELVGRALDADPEMGSGR
jgi:cytochrome c-type biogenesis protein CcmH